MNVRLKLCVVFLLMAFATTTAAEQPTTTTGVLLVSRGDFGIPDDDDISYLNLSDLSSGVHQLFTTDSTVSDLEYDPLDRMVYWTGYMVIMRTHLNGSDEVIYNVEATGYRVQDLVVDVVGRYIYWVNHTSTIYRAHLDGSGEEQAVVAPSGQEIDRLTIDPVHRGMTTTVAHQGHDRRLYWGGAGLWSSAMDGSQVATVLADPGYNIIRIEIDVTRNRLYWVGKIFSRYGRSFLATSQTDGQDYQVLVNTTDYIQDVAVDQDSGVIYWIQEKAIYQLMPHDSISNRQLVYDSADKTTNRIHLVSADAASAFIGL